MKPATKTDFFARTSMLAIAAIILGLVQGCGGGGSSSNPPPATTLNWSVQQTKTFHFTWSDVTGETEYRLMENPDGSSGYTNVATIAADATSHDLVVSLPKRVNARYILQSCNSDGCTDSNEVIISDPATLTSGIGYFKASDGGGIFGDSIAFSADGFTMAVGSTEAAGTAGAVYLFSKSGDSWAETGIVTASNSGTGDLFGSSVALSTDGSILAVGAQFEDGDASSTVVLPNDGATDSGAVYLFSNTGGSWASWTQDAYIKASNAATLDFFGKNVALSSDGTTLAVGAYGQGVSGAVYVFKNGGASWTETFITNSAANVAAGDYYGYSIALSSDGATLAVGVPGESSNATGINSGTYNSLASSSGAVYLYRYNGTSWGQLTYIKPSVTTSADNFGWTVALSADGSTLAVGAIGEDSSVTDSGAVYVFNNSVSGWAQTALLKASNPGNNDEFGGGQIALSSDGGTLAVAARLEDSSATGINGNQGDDVLGSQSGAAYLFSKSSGSWVQQAYVKASNTEAFDAFADRAVALSADGTTLAVGASSEASNATVINGDQTNNAAGNSGAVYLY